MRLHPETFADLKAANDAVGSRVAADSTADYVAATRKRARLAGASPSSVPGTEGTWRPVGVGPLHADDPNYESTFGDGFGELAGRISDYAYDAAHNRLYAAVASGGVWVSDDQGLDLAVDRQLAADADRRLDRLFARCAAAP